MLLRSNLLNVAHRIIPFENIKFQKWVKNEVVAGEDVPVYTTAEDIEASVQEIKTEMYAKLGLDMQKKYKWVYASRDIKGTDEQETPDRIIYQGNYWNAVKSNNWRAYDGWSGAIFVKVKDYVVQE